jgi:hypothetical protein
VNRRFQIVSIALLVLLALGVHGLQLRLDAHRSVHFVDRTPVFLPNGKLLRWMSMGYSGLVGDWLWLRSVLYFGRRALDEENPYYAVAKQRNAVESELRTVDRTVPQFRKDTPSRGGSLKILNRFDSRGLVDDIYPLLDRVTTVDPHFLFPYIFGGVYVLMDTGNLDDAEALLRKGLKENPESWKMPFYLGWIYWMYRGDPIQSREFMIQAVGKPECPEYVYRILGGVSREANEETLTRAYLEGILESIENPDIRSKIEALLKQLDVQQSMRGK